MAVKDLSASVLARLKHQAKEEKISFQTGLQLFVQEEFLRKLSKSNYTENMVLKGGMFIYTLTKFDSRVTRDIDFLIRDLHSNFNNIENVMKEICSVNTGNDFIQIEVLRTEEISVENKYPGIKTHFMGHIDNVRIPFSIDVGVDDIVVPDPKKRRIQTRLSEFESPEVYTYSLESTIAEKFDAILKRMEGTSRMKDFFDIYYLSDIFDFDGSLLQNAVERTLKHRNRELMPTTFDEILEFQNNTFLLTHWKAFEPAKNAGLEFSEVINRLNIFLKSISESIIKESVFVKKWNCENKSWT